MTTRIFAAGVPPQPVIEKLEDYVAPRREADSRLRWVWPEQWHLTTLFIDNCPDRSLDPLIDGLGEIASRTAPFTVELRGGGCFPDPFSVRVVFLGVTAGADELRALSKTSRALASSVGAPPDGTRFLPHLTLARTRTRIEGTRWLGVLDSFGQFEWQATELQVIRSHRGEGPGRRSRYERLATLPLAGPFDKLREPFDKLREPFDKLREPFNKLREPFDKLREPDDKLRKPVGRLREPFDKLRKPAG